MSRWDWEERRPKILTKSCWWWKGCGSRDFRSSVYRNQPGQARANNRHIRLEEVKRSHLLYPSHSTPMALKRKLDITADDVEPAVSSISSVSLYALILFIYY